MKSVQELMQTKVQLEEALEMVDVALDSEEYAKPFSFQLENPLTPKDFKSDLIRQILDRCTSREIGFDPNLTLQHIESEVLDQFNDIVKVAIKGKSIRTLMEIRHELELFMLTDRKKMHEHNLNSVNKELEKIEKELDEADEKDLGLKIVDTQSKSEEKELKIVATIGPDDKSDKVVSVGKVSKKK